jgi:hypothetical protein
MKRARVVAEAVPRRVRPACNACIGDRFGPREQEINRHSMDRRLSVPRSQDWNAPKRDIRQRAAELGRELDPDPIAIQRMQENPAHRRRGPVAALRLSPEAKRCSERLD